MDDELGGWILLFAFVGIMWFTHWTANYSGYKSGVADALKGKVTLVETIGSNGEVKTNLHYPGATAPK